jgi:hypothetical protein
VPAQRAQLAQAQAGGIEQFQQRAIAHAERHVGRHLDQARGLVGIEHLRQPAWRFRRADRIGRTGGDAAMPEQPAIEAAAGGQAALQALGRQPAPVFAGNERTQLLGLQRDEVDALGQSPCAERIEVASIRIQRMRRHAPLDLQVGEEVSDWHDRTQKKLTGAALRKSAGAVPAPTTRRAAHMDVRRFPTEPGWRVGKSPRRPIRQCDFDFPQGTFFW